MPLPCVRYLFLETRVIYRSTLFLWTIMGKKEVLLLWKNFTK